MTAATTTDTGLQPGADLPDVDRDRNPRPIYLPLDQIGLALRKAWLTYFVLAAVPPAAMIGSIFFLIFTGSGKSVDTGSSWTNPGFLWLLAGMVFLSVAIPLAFVIRRRMWAMYYEGEVVPPQNYLRGWLVVWLPLIVGGILGFVGLALSREVASIFTSMLSFIVFLSMAPNGHALVRPVGHEDDPAVYEEPK